MKRQPLVPIFALLLLLGAPVRPAIAQTETTVRIGVLAHNGLARAETMWEPTAVYLREAVPEYAFVVVPLLFDQVREAVETERVDLLAVNSVLYVQLEHELGVFRLATLEHAHTDQPSADYGGVLFTYSPAATPGDADPPEIEDLRGAHIAAVDPISLGGWLGVVREMVRLGLQPERFFGSVTFHGTHEATVAAVLSGEAEAGIVRTSTLEILAEATRVDLLQVRVIDLGASDFACEQLISTRTYADWPLASVPGFPLDAAKRIEGALLQMPRGHAAAAAMGHSGWTVPQSYDEVHALLAELQLPPFDLSTAAAVRTVVQEFWYVGVAALVALLALASVLLMFRQTSRRLAESARFMKAILDGIPDGIEVRDRAGMVMIRNRAATGPDRPSRGHEGRQSVDAGVLESRDAVQTDLCISSHGSESTWEVVTAPVVIRGEEATHVVESWCDISDRVRATEQMLEERDRAETYLDLSGAIVLELDAGGTVVRINSRGAEVLETTADNVVGKNWFESFVAPDDREAEREEYEQLVTSSEGWPALRESTAITVRGDLRIVTWHSRMLRTPDGEVIGVTCSGDDVTELRVYESALAKSEERYRLLIENQGEGVAIADEDEILQFVNPAAERIFGVPEGTLVGRSLSEFLDSRVDVRLRRETQRRRGGKSGTYELPIIRPDGTSRVLLITASPYTSGDGAYVGAFGVFRDITERKRMEESLRESERLLREKEQQIRTIMENIHAGAMLVHYPTHEIRRANPEAARLLGFPQDEIVGRTCAEFICGAPDSVCPVIDNCEEISNREQDVLTASRGRIPVLRSVVPVTLGGEHFLIESLVDISAQKETERKLDEARSAAEDTAQAKSAFLANMSHEIRTPLNGIIGMTDLLSETGLGAEQRFFADTVKNSAESLLDIINDILDFSKIEAGKLVFERIDFGVRVLLNEISDLVAFRAQSKGLEYVARVGSDVPRVVTGDPGRIRQILVNLIGNATKFTESGEIVVTVGLHQDESTRAVLRCDVTDTGIGISAEKLPQLFQPFNQLDESTTRRFGGSGLGLSISRRLAEIMGGAIDVQSTLGKGTTFTVTIPVGVPADQRDDTEPSIDLSGIRILAVDDNTTSRELLRWQLAGWGCKAVLVASGRRALEILRGTEHPGSRFDAILTDIQEPEMDGYELAREIRAIPELKRTPLILVTSIAASVESQNAAEAGFAAWLTKPVKADQLRETLGRVCGRPGAGIDRSPSSAPLSVIEDRQLDNVRVLLVEDNITNQKVAIAALTRKGCLVDAVGSGREAVDALGVTDYELVLMDVQMPEMSGLEATRLIRSGSGNIVNPQVPIVAMTAGAMAGDEEECLAAGMDGYVAKPVKPDELRRVVAKFVGCGRANAESPGNDHNPSDEPGVNGWMKIDVLAEMVGYDADLRRQVLESFTGDIRQYSATISSAHRAEDFDLIARAAHALQSASGTVGAVRLQEAALSVETGAKDGALNPTTVMELLDASTGTDAAVQNLLNGVN